MTAVPIEGGESELAELRRFAGRTANGRRLRLVIDDAEPIDVPPAVGRALADVIQILGRGRAVVVMAHNTELTTSEAAEILGVTRPTVVKLMEDGVLPFSRPNSSRRIALHDLLAYKEQRSSVRRAALDEMTADAVEAGFYERDIQKGRALHAD